MGLLEADVTEKLKTYLIKEYNVEIDESFYFSVNTTMQKVELFEPLIITEPTFYQKYFWGFVIVGITLIVIFIMLLHHRWNPILKRKKLQMPIKNALTLSVTIGHYTPSSNQRQNEIDDELEDLDGIEHDFDHIQDLFAHRLQYEMYPKLVENEYKMIWNEKQLKAFFESKALYLSKNIDNGKKFDALILIISSHGIPDYIFTSDYKLYSRLAIQRTFSFYPILRTIPRFILFDIAKQKDVDIDAYDVIEEQDIFDGLIEEIVQMDKNQNLRSDDTEKKVNECDIFDGRARTVKWGLNEENPDHLMGRVDSINNGFVNRLDRRFGSLCIHRFYQKYCSILDAKKREIPFLFEVFDDIQEELQLERKQPPESKWNDDTQYIVFKKNKK